MSKKLDTSAADQYLSDEPRSAETQAVIENATVNITANTIVDETANATADTITNINSNRKSIVIADILENIKDDKVEGGTHSFYLTNKTFDALVSRAKAKNISNSKFLEGILSQLFFEIE